MHTELATVPDFTLQCRSRQPGDCKRYRDELRRSYSSLAVSTRSTSSSCSRLSMSSKRSWTGFGGWKSVSATRSNSTIAVSRNMSLPVSDLRLLRYCNNRSSMSFGNVVFFRTITNQCNRVAVDAFLGWKINRGNRLIGSVIWHNSLNAVESRMEEASHTPFSTGEQPGMTRGETSRSAQRALETCFVLGVYCVIGGVLGFIGCIVGSFLTESVTPVSTGKASLSYGQEWFLIILPICALMGLGQGFASYLASIKQFFLSGLTFLFIAGLGFRVVYRMWSDQIADYGRDRSEAILYYSPTAMCILSLVLGLTVVIVCLLRKRSGKVLE